LIPDFIANCGVARLFAYLMENEGNVDEDAIFQDVSRAIGNAIESIYNESKELTNISQNVLKNCAKK